MGSVIRNPISTVQTPVLLQHLLKDTGIPQLQTQSREQTTFLRVQSLCKLRDSVACGHTAVGIRNALQLPLT